MTEESVPEVETAYDDVPDVGEPIEEEEPPGAAEGGQSTAKADGGEDVDPLSLPPHGSDVYVGGVPRSATSDQIRTWASKVGEVVSVTLAPDINEPSLNRGYGFVGFPSRELATTALSQLHDTELPQHPGVKIRVRPSTSKHRLFLGGLPHAMTEATLTELLKSLVIGLESVELVMSRESPGSNRGFAFLEFYNAECAKKAQKVLTAPGFQLAGRNIDVDFADPSRQGGPGGRAPAVSRNIFVGQLALGTTEDALRDAFSRFGDIERVHIPQRQRDAHQPDATMFAFVTFANQQSAVDVVEGGSTVEVNGREAVVRYGRGDEAREARGRGFGRGGGRGYSGYGSIAPGGMVPLVPVQLADGQIGYMMQPGMMMMAGGWQQGGYQGGGYRRHGGGRGGGRGGNRYQPY